MEKNKWSQLRNILCVRLDNMGDLIMTMPAIRALKSATSGRKITLLTSHYAEALARLYKEIDDIIVYDAAWISNAAVWDTENVRDLVRRLKNKHFDAAVVFTVYSQSPLPTALICSLAEIPYILAYCRENPYRLINEWIPDNEPLYRIKHEVTRQLDLVAYTGAETSANDLFIPVDPRAMTSMKKTLARIGVNIAKPWLALHPGVSETRRQYPADSYSKAIRKLTLDGWQIVLTGSKSEFELTEYIRAKTGKSVSTTAGMFDLKELVGLLSIAPLLISNNTGLVHIAAALKTPVVGVYAATNPQHYPWKVKHKLLLFDVPEKNRSKNIIIKYSYDKVYKNHRLSVTPDDIVRAVADLLRK